MKQMMTVVAGLFFALTIHAQKPSWAWATYGANDKAALVNKVAQDAAGNVYAVGAFTGTITFGDSTYTAQGIQDLYLVKYDNKGILLWSKAFKGTGAINANALSIGVEGDIYIGGVFTKTTQLGDSIFTSLGWDDMFIVKYDNTGKFCWANSYGTTFFDQIMGIGIDSKHNILIDGYFSDSTIQFQGIKLKSNNNYYYDNNYFLAKLDSDGHIIWAKNNGGKSDCSGSGLTIDKNDNIYAIGDFDFSIWFDSIFIGDNFSSRYINGSFIAKYDSGGHALWAKPIAVVKTSNSSNSGQVYCTLITTDTAGNPVIGGNYIDGGIDFGVYALPYKSQWGSGGMPDIWFAKYTTLGNFVWANTVGGTGYDYVYDVGSDKEGNLYLTGEYDNGCVFDTITLRNAPGRVTYMFVTKYNKDGRIQWVRTAGDAAGAVGNGLAVSNTNEVIVGGQFYGGSSIKFGNTTCYNTGMIGNGFVAKLSKSGVGIIPPISASLLTIAPNPASSAISVKMAEPGAYNKFMLKNTLGQSVANGPLATQQEQVIALPDLPNGIYYLMLSGNKESTTQKLSIRH